MASSETKITFTTHKTIYWYFFKMAVYTKSFLLLDMIKRKPIMYIKANNRKTPIILSDFI